MERHHNHNLPTARVVPAPIVLMADDDTVARENVADILREHGFDVRTARDGQDAVEQMERSCKPCAILLDESMPRMSGREVLKWLRSRKDFASVPVCVVSSDATPLTGASLAVRKPLLMNGIARILDFLRSATTVPRFRSP